MTDGARPTARLYPRIPHLPGSRLGPSERHAATAVVARMTVVAGDGDRVIVTEKLDGTSCGRRGEDSRPFTRLSS